MADHCRPYFANSAGTCGSAENLYLTGKDRIQREERKAGDPAVTRFLNILELDAIAEEPE
jgi:hypothetical protein